MNRKHRYKARIDRYKSTRESLRARHKKRMSSLTAKIRNIAQQIRRIEEKEARIRKLASKVKEFNGYSVHKSYPKRGTGLTTARYIFFKYGLECNIRCVDLAEYAGSASRFTPARARKSFNRKINGYPEYRDIWDRFKEFISNEQI